MDISCTKHTLGNGLDVLIHKDCRLPFVAISVWYHVGSKNEWPGRTGFAHLFEHLMFEGSEHHDEGFFQPLQEAGAAVNGSTNPDRTNYWEVVPTSSLELALWLESDRMGYLLPALTPEKFENQRQVVLNERRQSYENRPYGMAFMAVAGALFPPAHPYHWLTIGSAADIAAAQIDEARSFFETYYHPGNASLALAGDVDADAALALARRYFEEIPRGPVPQAVTVGPTPDLESETRLVLEDRVTLPRIYLAWRSPALFASGDAELDLLAEILANGKTSRLYRILVHDRRIATDVAAFQSSRELSGVFQIVATAAPGHALDELEQVISDEVRRSSEEDPTPDELARTRTQAEAHFVHRLQTVGGFGGKSDQLNAYNVFLGEPGFFGRDLARYLYSTADRIRVASAEYLKREGRVTLSVVPRGDTALAVRGSDTVSIS